MSQLPPSPRKPDFILSALNKVTNERNRIGAMWRDPGGSFTIKIDAFITVPSGPDFIVKAFPNEPATASAEKGSGATRVRGRDSSYDDGGEVHKDAYEDIPF